MGVTRHDPLYIILLLFVLALFCFTQLINSLAAVGEVEGIPWFTQTTEAVSDKYFTNITPTGLTFIIWFVIYAWQLAWIVFAHVIICVKSDDGSPLYVNPPIISPIFLAVYALNLCLNITWLFLWDREEMIWAMVVIVTIPLTLVFCIFHNCWMISKYRHELQRHARKYLIFNRLFVQNGLGIYATWTTIASHINLSIVLVYFRGMSQDTACTICLCVLAFIAICYFLLEVTSLEKHLRYLFTPWAVVMWALCGSLANNWEKGDRNGIISTTIVCLAFVFLVFKIGLTITRARKSSRNVYLADEGIDNLAMKEKA